MPNQNRKTPFMMNISKIAISFTIAIALSFGSLAYAGSSDRTTPTIVGAAIGGALGGIAGNTMQSTLLGAAVGGVAGNQLARHNQDKKAEKAAEQRHRATYQPYDKHNSRAYKASRKLNKKCHTKGNRDGHFRLAASKPENNFAGM